MSDLQKTLGDLSRGAWAQTALTIALERGLLERMPGPLSAIAEASGCSEALCNGVLDVLASQGLARREGETWSAAEGLADPRARALLLADLRATQGLHATVVAAARQPRAALEGWPGMVPEIVAAQGESSRAASEVMIRQFIPRMPGMDERLGHPGAAVLDVGAGAAGLGVAFCLHYPLLRVVGLEPSPVAQGVAREVIAAAGLAERIEIRPILGQELTDEAAYDFAYVAQMFIPDGAVVAVYEAVLRALRPGAVLATAAVSQRGDDAPAATSRLRNAVWGGGVRFPEDVVAQLVAAGFADVRAVPGPPGTGMAPVIAKRP